MKARLAILPCLVVLFAAERVHAEGPPVDIEVVEDDGGDFFDDEAPKEKAKSEEAEDEAESDEGGGGADSDDADDSAQAKAKKRAKEAFDELDEAERAKMGGASIKKKKKSKHADNENENINQQVVNVVVVGEKDTKTTAGAKNDAGVEAGSEKSTKSTPSSSGTAGAATSGSAGTAAAAGSDGKKTKLKVPSDDESCKYGVGTWKSWWERNDGIADGDVLVSYMLGRYGGGAYHGVGLEAMISNRAGLKIGVQGGFFNRHHGHLEDENAGDLDFFMGGPAATPSPRDPQTIERAILHKEDLTLTLHLGSRHGIDIVPSVGISHFGYWITADSGIARGGSGFLRLGAAAQYVYKRFFIGVDVGWYPAEIFRYGIEGRDGDGDLELVGKDIPDPFDSRRVTATLQMGLSL